ncbi:MAG: hypothetical protein KBC26_00135 [Candidatus Pacebacteria bacterium]|nr:hypothetical protein [Candidatus Paceibacterota bacterium]
MSHSTQKGKKVLPLFNLSVNDLYCLLLKIQSISFVIEWLKTQNPQNPPSLQIGTTDKVELYIALPQELLRLFDKITREERIDPVAIETLERWSRILDEANTRVGRLFERKKRSLRDLGGTCNIP